jgi:hypothetical protein
MNRCCSPVRAVALDRYATRCVNLVSGWVLLRRRRRGIRF